MRVPDVPVLVVGGGGAGLSASPGGGLGLNSAIQDAHNLCWKLSLVLGAKASDDLLDSYEPERRPVVTRNAENSLLTFDNHLTYVTAMGLVPGAPDAVNREDFLKLFADSSDGRQRRARVQRVFDAVSVSEYAPHDLEMGFQYESAAIVQDGTPWPPRDPTGAHYQPSTHPGCRLPHVWLHEGGHALSTHDLKPMEGFLLLTGPDGIGWVAAANHQAAMRNLRLRAVRVGIDVLDPSGGWARISEISPSGAVLVRPDGHVAFRAASAPENPERMLSDVFDAILARPVKRE